MQTLVGPFDLYPPEAGRSSHQLLDVRAPIEVERGAMPDAVHEPILDDDERHRVGVRYKEAGQEAAIRLGYAITEPHLPARIAAWRRACEQAPTAVICWRGGLRSKLALDFIDRPDAVRVAGGYKAIRAHVMAHLAPSLERKQTLVLTGLTGVGKTDLLTSLQERARLEPLDLQVLDLEAEAGHRGSAFGHNGVQPSQQTFENSVAARLLLDPATRLIVEDESRAIGRRTLPDPLFDAIGRSPVVVLEASAQERARLIHRSYVAEPSAERGAVATRDTLEQDLRKLKARLGGAVTERCVQLMRDTLDAGAWHDPEAHAPWIGVVLDSYYDPLYRRAIAKLDRPVLFRGSKEAVTAWLSRA